MSRDYMADMGAALERRIAQSYETRDDKGRRGILIQELPVPFMRMKPAEHLIDTVPYYAGQHDPVVKEGTPTYVCLVFAHMNVGPNGDNILCMSKNYNKPCGVCTEFARLREHFGQVDEDIYALYSASRRGIYYILCHDTPADEAKGLLITEMSSYLFENALSAQAKQPGSIGGYVKFAAPSKEEGKSISFVITGKGRGTRVEGLKFIQRAYDLPQELIKQASDVPLDALLVFPEYDHVIEMIREQTDRLLAGESATAVRPQQDVQPPQQQRTLPPREAPPAGPVVAKNLCPHGFMFGTVYKHTECNACDVAAACAMELAKQQQMGAQIPGYIPPTIAAPAPPRSVAAPPQAAPPLVKYSEGADDDIPF